MYPTNGYETKSNHGLDQMAGGCQPTQPVPFTITQHLDTQEQVIVRAHSVLDVLVDRLSLVLGKVTRVDNATIAPPSPPPNPHLTSRIPTHTRGIEALVSRLDELISRVEL